MVTHFDGVDHVFDVRKNADGSCKGTKFGFKTSKTLRRSDKLDKRSEKTLLAD